MTDRHLASVLITGFEPFGGDDRNPTQVIVERLGGVVLPTVYVAAAARLEFVLRQRQPAALLLCGLNVRANGLVLERKAFNEDNTDLADNAGEIRLGATIDSGGPIALSGTAPLDRVAAALDRAGLPWEWSDSAGRFLCNHVYYRALRHGVRCAFLHVPWPSDWVPERPGRLTLAQIETGVQACAAAIASEADGQRKEHGIEPV